MDWWKLFSGTFVLIFLAELGDKTQLAAMAKTADTPDSSMAKWVVFFGASLALASSTFIAVFLGHWLKRIVPDERYIRLAAAVLFLVFGFMILYEVYSSFREEKAGALPSVGVVEPGFAGGLALRAAMDFESLSVERYRRVAETAGPELKSVLLELAREEEGHLERLRGLPEEARRDAVWDRKVAAVTAISGRQLAADDVRVLEGLIGHEESSSAFYADLAERTLIPSVRSVLGRLAEEERSHAERLRRQLKDDAIA